MYRTIETSLLSLCMIAYDQCIGPQLISSCQDPCVCMQISLRNYYTMVVTILCYYYPLWNILYLHHITKNQVILAYYLQQIMFHHHCTWKVCKLILNEKKFWLNVVTFRASLTIIIIMEWLLWSINLNLCM